MNHGPKDAVPLTVGSLFSGIGGLELGLERAGMRVVWQVEINVFCRRLLTNHFPGADLYGDARTFRPFIRERVDVIAGGDPCPKRSRARSNGPSRSPDLSGYFLAVVQRFRPRWVVRENVLAPDVRDFDACLAALGYGSRIVRLDAAEVTGQSRPRDYVVACDLSAGLSIADALSICEDGAVNFTSRLGTRKVAACLTTHRTRHDSRDNYVWEPDRGLRILDSQERERLAGFPDGWTAGFSETTRARMLGNAAIPQFGEFIGRMILEAEA